MACDVLRHFNQFGHKGVSNVKISILGLIFADPMSEQISHHRDIIDVQWIHHLLTTLPMGINTMDKAPKVGKWYKMRKFNKEK